MPYNYGLKIKRQGVAKDVEDCVPKELAFHSSYPCAKIIQPGKKEFTIATGTSTEYTVAFEAVVAMPILVLAFMYDPSDSSYKGLGSEAIPNHTQNYRGRYSFDTTNLYLYVENFTGSSISSHFIYFICYT